MPHFAGLHPTLFTQLSLLLSFHRLLDIVPKISLRKTVNGDFEVSLLFAHTKYRSSSRSRDKQNVDSAARGAKPSDARGKSLYDTPSLSLLQEDSQPYFQIPSPSTQRSKVDLQQKPKHKSPSKLNRDRARLKAYRERHCIRLDPPSENTMKDFSPQLCDSPKEHQLNLISELVIEPMKHMIFILVFIFCCFVILNL